jgi:regulator of sigma E protease
VTHVEYGFGESISAGVAYGYNILKDYVKQFKYVFTKKGATQVGGFGAIGNLFPDSWNWLSFWQTTALISIILAFMNVLPIPALDGGHVMFLLYEMVTGRKPHDKFMEYAQMIGFFLLIALVLFANGNDIYRAIFDK